MTLDYELDDGPGYRAAYAERRGLDPLRLESAIVMPPPRPLTQPQAFAAAGPAPDAKLAEDVAAGRARFRERFEAHRQQQAQQAADEAAARDLVGRWDRLLVAFTAALPQLDNDPAYQPVREAMAGFGQEVRGQPAAVAVLRECGEAFGMGERPDLAKVLAHPRPDRLMGRLVEGVEERTRAELQEQAQQRAAQEEARRQELASRPRPSERSGPSMSM